MYNIPQAQKDFFFSGGENLTEEQQAVLFAKILISQSAYGNGFLTFCNDNELFVSKTPTGFDVVGFYLNSYNNKIPFTITVCKIKNLWYPSKKYVSADTKSCSGSILLWVLLSLGCTLMGILMYYLMSAAIGI